MHWRLILASAFAATTLDLMNPVTSFGEWLARLPGVAWLIATHINSAWHVPFGQQWLLAFGPSLAVFVVAAFAAFRLRPIMGAAPASRGSVCKEQTS